MMDWLNKTLSTSTADWLLVGGHHPVFSCGQKGPVVISTFNKLLPTLDYHRDKLDVYMAGKIGCTSTQYHSIMIAWRLPKKMALRSPSI
jgi:hypothetical protein